MIASWRCGRIDLTISTPHILTLALNPSGKQKPDTRSPTDSLTRAPISTVCDLAHSPNTPCSISIRAVPTTPGETRLGSHRICEALEPLDLFQYLTLTSSDSGGLHLYFPFETPLAILESRAGYHHPAGEQRLQSHVWMVRGLSQCQSL